MTKRMYVSVAIAALACATQAGAWGASDAQTLYEQGIKAQGGTGQAIDLPGGKALLEKAAAAGHAAAMHRLGDMYHDGDGGCVKDYAKALEWYRKEADLDKAHPGQGALGMMEIADAYARGQGVTKDQAQAMDWYKQAVQSAQMGASKGDLTAMLALAYCQMEGKGTKADPVQAWHWAIKSSETPNAWSQEIMASMYLRGLGVKKDPEAGLKCIMKAVQMGISQDMVDASLCFANGIGVKADQKAALEWAQKGVDRGNSRAMAILGRYYHVGTGVARSDATAKEWYQKAIDLGDEAALGFMGDLFVMPGVSPRDVNAAMTWYQEGVAKGDTYSMYQLAMVLTKDPDVQHNVANNNQAASVLRQAADLGSADAMNALGEMYRSITAPFLAGTADERDRLALEWFKKAADLNLPAGMRNLGEMIYEDGMGRRANKADDDPKLLAEGISWLNAAAAAGDAEAMADLGEACEYGIGMSQSMFVAATWFRKAGDAGSVRAMRNLGLLYLDGRSLGTDYQSAYKWLKMASDAKDPRATAGLGELFELGVGLPQPAGAPAQSSLGMSMPKPDYMRASQLYLQAIQANESAGYRGMAHLYQEGLGFNQDLAQAVINYQKAVDRHDQRAMEALGWMYELGQGVPKNASRARRLFQQSFDEFGSTTAWSWLVSHDPDSTISPGTAPAPSRGGSGGG